MAAVSTPWSAPHVDGPVRGRVTVPGSKSVTNRALLLAALSGDPASVAGAPATRDTALMVDALRALGIPIEVDGETVTVGAHGALRGGEVDCGLAGTVMRFVPPAAALAAGEVRFDGDPRARERPMGTVLDALGVGCALVVARVPLDDGDDLLGGRDVEVGDFRAVRRVDGPELVGQVGRGLGGGVTAAHGPIVPRDRVRRWPP